MPSKNKTELLKLNQWQENEYPKMDDFNSDNKKIDDAYKGIVNKLNDKAEKSYVDDKISDIDFTALENKIDKKANESHTHSANDIAETSSKKFVTSSQLSNIDTITNKADKSHTHSANDITETYSKKFVTTSEKLKINDIDNKAEKSYVDENISRTSTIVIANYDSHDNSKKGADIVIEEGENASKKINDAIQSLKGSGGEVKLMEGNYNLEHGIAVSVDGVHLTGIPKATILVQNTNWKYNPYAGARRHIIDTLADDRDNRENLDVKISNLYIKGAKVGGSYGFYCLGFSTVINCIVENSGGKGFLCEDSSTVTNCISENSGGFQCGDSSTVTNCISKNNSGVFWCSNNFKGICAFNTLIGDNLKDSSSSSAVVQYNIIKEE